MATDLSIETAGPELKDLLKQLPPGGRLNLVGSDGERVAVVVSSKRRTRTPVSREDWLARLDALAERITKAWKSDKNAVEIISEMRR